MMTEVTVHDFKWIKGKNDAEYIDLLEDQLERNKQIITKAVAKIRVQDELISKQDEQLKKCGEQLKKDIETLVDLNNRVKELENEIKVLIHHKDSDYYQIHTSKTI